MYTCNKCNREATVDHINPPKLNCECVDAKVVTSIHGTAYGRSSLNGGAAVLNNNLSEASALLLRNTFFAIAANEFFVNKKSEIKAIDVHVKDSESGREFSFTLTGKEI